MESLPLLKNFPRSGALRTIRPGLEHGYGLRRLAARQPRKTLFFGIEQSSELMGLRDFLRWIDKFELGDLGAYNGNIVPPGADNPTWRLMLAAQVPAFESFFDVKTNEE
jgi:hypothetical protein